MVRRPVLYPRIYPWYVAVATADVLLTWFILARLGGWEVNPIARGAIELGQQAGGAIVTGAAFLKFATVMFVMVSCEVIGRRNGGLGRRVLAWAVALNCVPVTAGLAQLAVAAPSM